MMTERALLFPKFDLERVDEHRAWLATELEQVERVTIARVGPIFENISLLSEFLPLMAVDEEVLAFRVIFGFHLKMRFAVGLPLTQRSH